MRPELDCNVADEKTAVIFIECDLGDEVDARPMELNIQKDENGSLTEVGYVCEYANDDDTEPVNVIGGSLLELEVTEHDFDETLRDANEKLLPFGMKIELEYDGEMYWDVLLWDDSKREYEDFAGGNFDHEVSGLITECLVHALARAKHPELVHEPKAPAQRFREAWAALPDEERPAMLAELYNDLGAYQADEFLRLTGNQ